MPKRKKRNVSYWHKQLIGPSGGKFSRYIRLRDTDRYMKANPRQNELGCACISCGKFYPIKLLQAGHFITTQKTFIKYDEANVNAQCYNCNYNLKGNWSGYYQGMLAKYGQATIDRLLEEKSLTKTFNTTELEELYNWCVERIKEFEKVYGKVWA